MWIQNVVSTQIHADEHRAIFVHCIGHVLNLAAGDTITKQSMRYSGYNP